jgi:hypothetical protein
MTRVFSCLRTSVLITSILSPGNDVWLVSFACGVNASNYYYHMRNLLRDGKFGSLHEFSEILGFPKISEPNHKFWEPNPKISELGIDLFFLSQR